MLNKPDLRRALLAARQAVAPDIRASCDTAISERLRLWLKAHPLQSLGVYWPIRAEPDLRPLYTELSQEGMQLALPVVLERNTALRFAAWTPGDALECDSYGVPTPVNREYMAPEGLLIPCVGFNEDNIRLGYGGGFYDRTLSTSPRPLAIGIAYASTRSSFTAGPHDVALDVIITD